MSLKEVIARFSDESVGREEKMAQIVEWNLNLYGKYSVGSKDKAYLEKVKSNLNIESELSIEDKGEFFFPRYSGLFKIKENIEDA